MKLGYAGKGRPLQWVTSWALWLLLVVAAQAQSPAAAASAAPTPVKDPRVILVMGDSLSAGYGMAAREGWVSLLGEQLSKQQPGWRVVNASISGETSAGGSSRIVAEVLRHRPSVVVIELGSNDGLRGLPLRELRRNLARMIGASQHVGAKVLLVGMQMPPNLGPDYTGGFNQTYRDLARLFGTELLPFLLEPIALDRNAYQDDNLHPTPAVQPKIRDHVWAKLKPMLK